MHKTRTNKSTVTKKLITISYMLLRYSFHIYKNMKFYWEYWLSRFPTHTQQVRGTELKMFCREISTLQRFEKWTTNHLQAAQNQFVWCHTFYLLCIYTWRWLVVSFSKRCNVPLTSNIWFDYRRLWIPLSTSCDPLRIAANAALSDKFVDN